MSNEHSTQDLDGAAAGRLANIMVYLAWSQLPEFVHNKQLGNLYNDS